MTIKKKKLFKKNIVILFVLVALLVLVTYLLNPKNQEDKQLSPASKTFYKTDSQGKDDYVLTKEYNIIDAQAETVHRTLSMMGKNDLLDDN